ncbi:hypothetical protein R1flu_014285 [Riccia fluitans]|uniref:Inward rectifier potassium channel C-terminal domain-containing protein n=1 Tax=Riccia fluitans TaxID=41844 RepID=A0ABD1YFN1_9MARC
MSAVSLLFLFSPVPSLHVVAPSQVDVCRCRSGGRPRVIRGQKDSGVSKPRNRLAVKAGIGRYSGAVHGGNAQRGRRRRPTLRPEECDEHADDNDSIQGDRVDGIEETDAEPAIDHTDSYRRYLSELGIIEQNGGKEYQAPDIAKVTDGTIWVPIGTEGDLGYRHVDNGAVSNKVEEGGKETNGAWERGEGGGDGFAEEDKNKVKENRSGRGRRTRNNRVYLKESTASRSECESAAETVTSSQLISEKTPEEVDENVDSIRAQGDVKPSPSVQVTENDNLKGNGTLVSSRGEATVEGRKQRRKAKKKSPVNADVAEVERQVRVVDDEAEQPSATHALRTDQKRGLGRKDYAGGRPSDEVNVDLPSSVLAVNVIKEREETAMVQYTSETLVTGRETADSVAPVDDGSKWLLNQSMAVISDSMTDSVNVFEEEPYGASGFLSSELRNEILGERSEFVNDKVDTIVVEADTEKTMKNVVVDGIQLQTMNSTSVISRTITESSDEEFLAGPSPSIEKGPVAAMAMDIGDESVPVVEQAVQVVSKVVELPVQVASKVVELPAQVASKVVDQATQVGTLVVEQVAEILPDAVTEQVGQVVSHVVDLQAQFSDQVSLVTDQVLQDVTDQVLYVGQMIMVQVSEAGESVVDQVTATAEQVAQVAESVTSTANQVVEQVTATAEQVAQVAESVTSTANQVVEQVTEKVTDILSFDDDYESDSDDEFEAYKTTDDPAFRGSRGLANFVILQENQGVLTKIYDLYTYMLKQPLPKFAAAMFSAPIAVSLLFTLLYLPEYKGLAFDDTARDFFAATDVDSLTLQLSWRTMFQVFMFSVSLSTGLEPELAPLSPYTLVIANINALVAQLVFVFLSGAVFARLSQPAQPVRCSSVALVSTSPAQRKKENAIKVLMTRYVLAGPQPCELVDVKVDLTYKYNTSTRTGSYFRATQSLKLVRPEIAFLTHGMLVRHVIDSTSPLYQRTSEMLRKEDAVFSLSVVGLERSSMQSVFHVQHYCVCDDHVIWDAEFEDLILVNSKKDKRIVDHSRLSMWRPIEV